MRRVITNCSSKAPISSPVAGPNEKLLLGDQRDVEQQRTFLCPHGGAPTAETPPRKYSPGLAKLLSFFPQQVHAGNEQNEAEMPHLVRDSSQQRTDPKDVAKMCSRHRLANMVLPHLCRGLPTWKGEVRTRCRWMKAAGILAPCKRCSRRVLRIQMSVTGI